MTRGRKTGGRRAGTPNRLTGDIKTAIENAFVAVGGQGYLEQVARQQPHIFCALLARVLPRTPDLVEPTVVKAPVYILDVAKRIAFIFSLAEDKMSKEELPLLRRPSAGGTSVAW